MERPLEDTTTVMLWKTLFATIVEPGIRSGLFTAEELISLLVAPPDHGSIPPENQPQEEREGVHSEGANEGQELGEESAQEEDPLGDLIAEEPDAETEPSAATKSGLLPGGVSSMAVEPAGAEYSQ